MLKIIKIPSYKNCVFDQTITNLIRLNKTKLHQT